MPGVARGASKDSVSVHECGVVPRCDSASADVFINGEPCHRVTDTNTSHPFLPPPAGCPTHVTSVTSGSTSVFCNGKGVARLGDPYGCGITITSSSTDVICG